MLSVIILLIVSIAPVVFFAYQIYKKDFDKEPTKILVKLFFCGLGSIIVTLIITRILQSIFPFFALEDADLNLLDFIPYVFIGIALIEEFSKWIFVYLLEYNDNEFNHLYDGIVYAAFVALGFACFENILYVFSYGIETGILRAITAIPGHLCDGIMMGYYLSMAKLALCNNNKALSKKNLFLSLLVPVLAHGVYDYTAFATQFDGGELFAVVFIVFIIFFFIYCSKKVKQLAQNTYNLNPSYISINDRNRMAQNNVQYNYQSMNNGYNQTSYPQQTIYNNYNQSTYPQQPMNNGYNQTSYPQQPVYNNYNQSTYMQQAISNGYNQTSYEQQSASNATKYCNQCGQVVIGKFCPNCGNEIK